MAGSRTRCELIFGARSARLALDLVDSAESTIDNSVSRVVLVRVGQVKAESGISHFVLKRKKIIDA